MGLVVMHGKSRSYPILVCDACGEKIDDWQKAVVSWNAAIDATMSSVSIYHKVRCDPHERYWMQLDQYIPWLLSNHNWGEEHISQDGKKLITIEVPKPLAL